MNNQQDVSLSATGAGWSVQVHMQPSTTNFKVEGPESCLSPPSSFDGVYGILDSTVVKSETSTTNGNSTFTLEMQNPTRERVYRQFVKLENYLSSMCRLMAKQNKD